MDLKLELQRAKEREWDQNESALASHLAPELPTPPTLDEETSQHLQPFVSWASNFKIRYCPARPSSVAGFIFAQAASKVPEAEIFDQVAAVARLHDTYSLSDPTSSTAVRGALERVLKEDGETAPRSWRSDEKTVFWTLPKAVRGVINRREHEREKVIRRAQNEAGNLRRLMTAAEKPVDNTEKEFNIMAKDKGVGPYTDSNSGIVKRETDPGANPPKQIWKKVEGNQAENDGFSGPVKSD